MQITIRNNQCIEGLNNEQKNKIKEALTFDNPKYKQAKRYGRSKYISIPPYLTYYEDNGDYMNVPFGFNISSVIDNCPTPILCTNMVHANYPDIKIELREDQWKAIQGFVNYKRPFNSINNYGIIQLPTGKGKSILAIYMAQHFNQKALILVHKDDLVVGWKKDIAMCFNNKLKVGLIKAKSRTVGEQFTIATVQTLARMSEEELSQYTNQFGMIITDECLVGNTLVTLSDGGVKQIKHIIDKENVIGGEVSNKFSRKSQIYELQSNNALIKGSPTHPTWCVKRGKKSYSINDFECKPIKDITRDYYIPILTTIPHTEKNKLSLEEARFVAMIMCDGHLDKTGRRVKVNVKKNREYYYDVMKSYADSVGAELKQSTDIRGNATYWFTDDRVKELLTVKWGVPVGKKSDILTIPSDLYYSPLESIKAFIETCFNCEGDISVSDRGSVRVNFNSISEDFVQGLCILLKKFGVVANVNKIEKRGNHSTIYRLSVAGVFYNKFACTFNLLERKSSNLRNCKVQNIRFVGDYYLSPVKRVKELEYEDTVYDFTVSGEEHSFIANGVYTHNCHHIGANSFNIIDKFNCHYKIGLSATPTRTDGLNQCFDLFLGGVVYKHDYSKDDKDILPVKVRVKETKAMYRPFVIKNSKGEYATDQFFNMYDYKVEDLPSDFKTVDSFSYKDRPRVPYLVTDNAVVLDRKYKIRVCKDIIDEVRQGHSCLALFTQKEHIEKYYQYLCRYLPKDQILLYYGDSKEKSEVMMKRAESKEALITLGTLAKTTEGTNVKAWEVLFLVSSMNNEKNVEQATGRIRRSNKGKLNPVIVYDYIHPCVVGIQSHFTTRKNVYNRLKYDVKYLNTKEQHEQRRGLFSRGY